MRGAYRIMTNNRPGICASCGADVPAKDGFAFLLTRSSKWQVACTSEACDRAIGLSGPDEDERTLRQGDGCLIVRTPKDQLAFPLLRSFPGARWNPDRVAWIVSAKIQDRPRVLEIADQLKLDVDPSLRTYALPRDVTEADERAKHPGLYPFQREGVRHLALHSRALLADDMGLGKTVQALCALPAGKPAIVICPKSVKLNWRDECKKWRSDLWPVVVANKKDFRAPLVDLCGRPVPRAEVLIINDDILPDSLLEPGQAEKFATEFKDCTLVQDEAHRSKNYKTKRSKKVKALGSICARHWQLTGTPLLNHPEDLFGVLESGGTAREVFTSFKKFQVLFNARRVQHSRSGFHTEYGQPTAEVPERLKRIMLRRTKAEALPDLPAKVYKDHSVNGLSASLRWTLDEAWEEYGELMDMTGDLPPFEAFSALRAKIAGERIDAMLEIVEDYEEQDTPLVVFSAHRAPVDALGTRDGWRTITGSTSTGDRQEAVSRFQTGELKGIALTIQAGGVGITLTRASHVLFVDLDWTPALNAQAEDRVCRIGQTAASIQVTRMISDHPLDRHVTKLLAEKQALIENAVNAAYKYTVLPGSGRGVSEFRPHLVPETDAEMRARKSAIETAARHAEDDAKEERMRAIAVRRWPGGFAHPEPDRAILESAIDFMLGRCDGAIMKDGQGFNKPDAAIMHWAGVDICGSENGKALAWSILRHYPRQLKDRYPEIFVGAKEAVTA